MLNLYAKTEDAVQERRKTNSTGDTMNKESKKYPITDEQVDEYSLLHAQANMADLTPMSEVNEVANRFATTLRSHQCPPQSSTGCPRWRNNECKATWGLVEEEAARTAREEYTEDLWKWCLINGAEQHGDVIGLPTDPFFPLKLIKKIAEMHYETMRKQSKGT